MIRKFTIIYITPLVWKFFPQRKALALQEFSAIEKDSGCQLLWALELTPNMTDKALIFQHVLEEFFHAEIFDDLSHSFSENFLTKIILPREILVDRQSSAKDVWNFFSYAHVGEEGVNKDFSHYAKANFEKKVASIFSRVSEDESQHIYGTKDILINMTGNRKIVYTWLILKASIKRKYKQLQSSSRFIGDALLMFFLGLVYFVFGLFIHKTLRARFSEMSDAHVFNLLKLQEEDV